MKSVHTANLHFKILRDYEFDAEYLGSNEHLTKLGGCSDYGDEYGLGEWMYQFEVEVTNQGGETKVFTVAYQPEARINDLKNYNGYSVTTASQYGYDADESDELVEFCEGHTAVLDTLHDIAKTAAKAELDRLTRMLEDDDIQVDTNV